MSKVWLGALVLVPCALALEWLHAPPIALFATAVVAIVPLAEWMRRATEQLAGHAGATIGGLLNTTFGNAAELILALFVLTGGDTGVVKAQITGSIIGNGLLGLGVASLAGTWHRERLQFKTERAALLSSLLVLAMIALLLPALFDYTERGVFRSLDPGVLDERLSLGVAIVLIIVYAANIAYTLFTHRDVFRLPEVDLHGPPWPLWRAIAVLLGATAATALVSDVVARALADAASTLHVSKFFVGVVVLAVIGNAAEYLSAIYFARRGRMGLVMTLTVGSTVQVALFVAPVLVLVSWLIGHPMNLVFENPLELVAIAGVAFAVNAISRDGEVTWFEGLLLVALYCLLALAFFFAAPAAVS